MVMTMAVIASGQAPVVVDVGISQFARGVAWDHQSPATRRCTSGFAEDRVGADPPPDHESFFMGDWMAVFERRLSVVTP
jgi:hypothetical protein